MVGGVALSLGGTILTALGCPYGEFIEQLGTGCLENPGSFSDKSLHKLNTAPSLQNINKAGKKYFQSCEWKLKLC